MQRRTLPTRLGAGFAASALVLLGATACEEEEPAGEPDSSQTEETDESEESEEETEESDDTTDESGEDAEGEAAGGDGTTPAWAYEATTPGEQIAELTVGDVDITVYQVGTGTAPEDSNLVDSETNEPLLKEGDEVVYFNYVITNNGDPIDLGSSMVSVDVEYDDWAYLGGMPTVTDDPSYEEQGINPQLRDPSTDLPDPPIYTFGTGETISYGAGHKYQAGSGVTIEASYTPVDEAGDLIHDDGQEAETTATVN